MRRRSIEAGAAASVAAATDVVVDDASAAVGDALGLLKQRVECWHESN